MNIIENVIKIGILKPFEIIHASDTHIIFADERDNERKNILSTKRRRHFPCPEENLEFLSNYAKEKNLPIMYTGDLIDFVSEANLDAAYKFTHENFVFCCAGNHEYSQYVGEATEDEDYRNQSLPKVQKAFTNDIRFDSLVLNGINFIAIDNSYYYFDKWQLERLKEESKKNLPIVLLMHNPLYNKEIFDYVTENGTKVPAYLNGVPDELMKDYEESRFIQQKSTDTTLETLEFIKNDKNIKLLLTGHLHRDYEHYFCEDRKQIITGCETIRVIRFE